MGVRHVLYDVSIVHDYLKFQPTLYLENIWLQRHISMGKPCYEVFIDYTIKLNMCMAGIDQAASDLFFKLRNRFPKITMGDENTSSTTNPETARFFSFDYEEDEVKFGNVTASLIDKQA